jgi:hypothetical protein
MEDLFCESSKRGQRKSKAGDSRSHLAQLSNEHHFAQRFVGVMEDEFSRKV